MAVASTRVVAAVWNFVDVVVEVSSELSKLQQSPENREQGFRLCENQKSKPERLFFAFRNVQEGHIISGIGPTIPKYFFSGDNSRIPRDPLDEIITKTSYS